MQQATRSQVKEGTVRACKQTCLASKQDSLAGDMTDMLTSQESEVRFVGQSSYRGTSRAGAAYLHSWGPHRARYSHLQNASGLIPAEAEDCSIMHW